MNYERKVPTFTAGPGPAVRLARAERIGPGRPSLTPRRPLPAGPRLPRKPEARLVPPAQEIKASFHAQKLAREHGLDLLKIKGTGPGGLIGIEDVRQAIATRRKAT